MAKKKPAAASKVAAPTKPKKSSAPDPILEPLDSKRFLPEQILALTRITSSKLVKAARDRCKDGKTYDVDFGVRVTGQVVIGSEVSFTGNNTPKASDLIQALLAQFGPRKRQQIVQSLITAGLPRTIAPDDKPIEGLADLAAELIDGLTTTSRGTRAGNVTGDCALTLIEWTP